MEKLIEKTATGKVVWHKAACRSFCATFSSAETHLRLVVKKGLGEGYEMEISDLGGSRVQTESAYVNRGRGTVSFRLLKLLYKVVMKECRNPGGLPKAILEEVEKMLSTAKKAGRKSNKQQINK